MDDAELAEIERYITSGNEVPIERCTLPAEVIKRLLFEIRLLHMLVDDKDYRRAKMFASSSAG